MSAATKKEDIYGTWGSFTELLRSSLRAILANKMRSFLTTLGIIIGVLSVVAVVSILQGVFQSFLGQFSSLGGDTMFIRSNYEMFKDRRERARRLKMTYENALAVGRGAQEVKAIAPFLMKQDTIAYRGRKDSTQIFGTTESYGPITSLGVETGRFIGAMDVATRRKVCVIGRDILDKLALPDQCLGTEIQIGRGTYTIVGVAAKKGGSLGQSEDDRILVPITTAIQQYGQVYANDLILLVQVRDPRKMDEAKEEISGVLRREHGLKFGQTDDFRIFTMDEILSQIKQFTTVSTLIVAAIVGITLIVGGIGIMNIMLVSVTERTREIGIRMAVGAKRAHILYQFLIESVTLATLGGVVGLLAGWGISVLTVTILRHTVTEGFPAAYVPVWVIFLSLGFAAFTGAVFGVYPAFKASRLDPIDALRYE